ncbi:30S ribosomal protein S16 [Candidatus Gracilibacteria bacterium]|nr:30S ribosomal protein S16 [Candidatus Gracilibacteria bacterium]
MLRIRLQRIGRKNRAEYRIVVAEKHIAVKKQVIDVVGHYLPTRSPKVVEINHDKVSEWISKGAQPTDTVAVLCKNSGMKGMEKYIAPRNKKPKVVEQPKASAETPAPAEEAETTEAETETAEA